MPLQIEARQERTITVIQLEGEAVDGDALRLRHLLEARLQTGEKSMILAVDGLVQMDSPSISVLIDMQAQVEQAGGDIRLAGARLPLLTQLAECGVEQKFPKFDNVDSALTSFDGLDSRGVKHFDILEFVKEQEREDEQHASSQASETDGPAAASTVKDC